MSEVNRAHGDAITGDPGHGRERDMDTTTFNLAIVARTLAAIAIVGTSGCATTHLAPIDTRTPVTFVVTRSPPAQGNAAVHDTSMKKKAGSGMKLGATGGALASLACGPFVVFCLPLTTLGGSIYGGTTGLVVGAATSLPKGTLAQLNERLDGLQQSYDPVDGLRTQVLERAREHWQLTDEASARVVTLEVLDVSLAADGKNDIKLVMQVLVHADSGTERRFEYVSTKSQVTAWLDEHSEVPEHALDSACRQIADQVVTELTRA